MTVAEYINKLLSIEEYAFSISELNQQTTKSEIALKRELSRLVEKKQLINLRKGFYLIIPPRYSNFGILPIELYIDKLFNYLKRDYYIAFYSAAKYHSASHQQIQKEYVITSLPPVYNINKKSINVNIFNASNWPKKNIIKRKSDAGYFNISSPVLTLIDLVHFHRRLGGLSRILLIIKELTESLTKNDISDLLSWYPHKSTIQRTGYLLEEIEVNKILIEPFYNYLQKTKFFPVLLSPRKGQKPGKVNSRWKIDVNIELESDL
ncbi:MAG: type IV toxin-antitoxin system AbiEi family antitoxin [Ignavibacteriales bacterium]|nr:type IV toxin-antitoxin system AbiEi family antitoxin [Ignavibacteriales bacterium]